ncbi:hypothetical protein BDN70DRAFT_876230 [Pholiota conissans]|uniref:Pentatricopeptide repeat-containing protein-mitochondrial domain-containing protein n=1 Tax=Pholiota conissans TaxID=109636 RepID=A0A9P6CW86_9AGAR|nr:hypothetical protein BDN70DRAFT_876230 [Pholiota conissans]
MFAARALRPSRLLLSKNSRLFHSSLPRCKLTEPARNLSATEYAVQIMATSNSGFFSDCLQLAHGMKADGIKPELETYNTLLSLAARDRAWLFAWAIFDDMILSGIKPTPTTFVHLIQAQIERPHISLWNAIDRMQEHGVKPTAPIYTAIINCLVREGNTETALQHILTMKAQNIVPELSAVQAVVSLLASQDLIRLAIEIATWYEAVSRRRMENQLWVECLTASAKNLYIDGVRKCWPLVVDDLGIFPTESVMLAVLNTAARHGEPELAADVIRVLQLAGIDWEEHHFAALIEAFCRNGQMKEALISLAIVKSNNITPTSSTTSVILDSIKSDVESLDAAWALIDEIHESESGLDIEAIKVVIEASIYLGDLQRAVGIYKSLEDYGLKPDLATFNLLLDGCIGAQHRQLGDLLLAEMKDSKIKPDSTTFEKLIELCLTQDIYEDAFFYLEEMKSAGYVPPVTVYDALLKKCISADDTRSIIVLEEMKECGYKPQDSRHSTAANATRVNKQRRKA